MSGRFVVLSLLVLIPSAAATAPTTPVDPRVDRVERGLRPVVWFEGDPLWTLAERMEHYGTPGISVAVIEDGKIAWYRGWGVADRETGEPVTADTLFQAGSVSKPVAALGAVRMAADGLLALDGNVNDTLESWKVPENEFTRESPVTLTGLLSHTAGLTVHGFPGYAAGDPLPTIVQVLDGHPPANTAAVRVDSLPGSNWRYSGGGYTVAQLLMSDAADRPFEVLMRETVLEPLEMKRSTFENPLPPAKLAAAAAGILPDGSAVKGKRHVYPEMAAAGLWTTAEDLARFGIEVQQALAGRGRVLSREAAELLVEPVTPGYGRGFGLWTREDGAYFGHNGWDEGFCAQLTLSRDGRHGAALMINSNHPDLMTELVNAIAHEYGWPGYRAYVPRPIDRGALKRYSGRFRYNSEQSFAVERKGKRLFMQYVGGDPEELLHIGDGRFMRRGRTAPITFTETNGVVEFHFLLPDGGRQSHPQLAQDAVMPRELRARGDYDRAVAAYRAILDADANDAAASEDYLNNTGLGLVDEGHHEVGTDLLRVAADLYPQSANTWDSLGYAWRVRGDDEQALEYYRLALERDPGFPSAVAAVAELVGGQGD
ncbi:MAG TPA: serine hydrolase [Candidatus Polarisedimenticolaceae bacterium]|nr:serine hydrolase [Candidatus Polarisedimenticolaceae bacterium]